VGPGNQLFLRLFRQGGDALVNLPCRVCKIPWGDDIVAVKDGSGLVAADCHSNPLGDTDPDEVSHGGASEVVGDLLL
jgi:hypothetical protein